MSGSGKAQILVHVPTPGDHYSAATGSATMTVIHELVRCHAAAGGISRIVVNEGTRHDYAEGECVVVRGAEYPPKWKKAVDRGLSRIGLGRPLSAGIYRPHLLAIGADFDDPILIHNGPAGIPLARKLCPRAPICLWAHNELFRSYGEGELRGVIAAADRVFCCSGFIAEQLKKRLPGGLARRVRVVHNGVDAERFVPAEPTRNAVPVVLFVGRMQQVKGADLLIRAAVKLAEQGVKFQLRMVGSKNFSATDPLTAYEEELRLLAEPIKDRVEFRPFTDRTAIVGVYQSADVNVVPSNWDEPFGLTVLEALACGLPSVVSRRGGIPEAAGDAALFFDPPDVEQLAGQLKLLLTDANARNELSWKARAQAVKMTWEHSYQQLLQGFQ
jgi:glycosyltransferase involved in cell wall biosynthesis